MFRNAHVRELQPADWQQQLIGSGTFGKVYKAVWREEPVAVKVIKLPERTAGATVRLKMLLRNWKQNSKKIFKSLNI